MLYEVRQGESIYDVAVKLYGSVSYCVKLCEDNGIDLNTDISHLFLEYDPSIKTRVNVQFTLNSITQVPDRSYFIKEGQSIYDLALMFGYGIENVAAFCSQHFESLDETSIGGQTILVTKIKTKLSQFVTLNNLQFATTIAGGDKAIWDGEFGIWDGTFILRAT